jgi:cobalt/nickel transport system permease protein
VLPASGRLRRIHIPEGILNPYICIAMYIAALLFLVRAWKGIRKTFKGSFIPLIAVVSALTFVVQFVEFPLAGGGSTWHFMGGTMVSMVLGPSAAIISMTLTLIIQALIGDGGITSFGANVFNMAIIGALSFFIVKLLVGKNFTSKRLAASVFVASWVSNILTALAVGIDIGIYPLAGELGGLIVTVPTMMVWYVPTGLIEGIVAALLILPLSRLKTLKLHGIEMLHAKNKSSDLPPE